MALLNRRVQTLCAPRRRRWVRLSTRLAGPVGRSVGRLAPQIAPSRLVLTSRVNPAQDALIFHLNGYAFVILPPLASLTATSTTRPLPTPRRGAPQALLLLRQRGGAGRVAPRRPARTARTPLNSRAHEFRRSGQFTRNVSPIFGSNNGPCS